MGTQIGLNSFMGRSQLLCLRGLLKGEEKNYFKQMLRELVVRLETMPKIYEQDGLGDKAIVHLHYFRGNMDWWITEKDAGDGPEDQEQHQAFGLADLGYGAELGYISIVELVKAGIELDLYWTPKTLEQIKAKLAA